MCIDNVGGLFLPFGLCFFSDCKAAFQCLIGAVNQSSSHCSSGGVSAQRLLGCKFDSQLGHTKDYKY